MLLTERRRDNNASDVFGFNQLGQYELQKKKLEEERKRDYQRYLAEKQEQKQREIEKRLQQQVHYEEMLRKKKEEERRYRDINGDIETVEHHGPLTNSVSLSRASEQFSTASESTNLSDLSYSPSFVDRAPIKRNAPSSITVTQPAPEPEKSVTPQQSVPWLSPTPTVDRSATASTQGNSKPNGNSKPQGKTPQHYREELEKQIEERKKRDAETKAKEREEEQRLAKRIEDERLKMLREYEEEVKAKKAKEEEAQKKQELLHKKRQEMEAENATFRKRRVPEQRNEEPHAITTVTAPLAARSRSPPIPTLREAVCPAQALEPPPQRLATTTTTTNPQPKPLARKATTTIIRMDSSSELPNEDVVKQLSQFRKLLSLEQHESNFQPKNYRVSNNRFEKFDAYPAAFKKQSLNNSSINNFIRSLET